MVAAKTRWTDVMGHSVRRIFAENKQLKEQNAMREALEVLGNGVGHHRFEKGWWLRREWVRQVVEPFVCEATKASWR